MLHAAADVLGQTRAQVEDIDGTDAPKVVVAVLPVQETVFPHLPVVPLARGVAVGVGKAVELGVVAELTRLAVDRVGRQRVADDAPQGHTAHNHHRIAAQARAVVVAVVHRQAAPHGEIDAASAPRAVLGGAGHEVAGAPARGAFEMVVALRVAEELVGGIERGAVVEGAGRDEDVHRSPDEALGHEQHAVPHEVVEDAVGQHHNPLTDVIAALVGVGGHQDLNEQVVEAQDAVEAEVVNSGVVEAQRGGEDVHHHGDGLREQAQCGLVGVAGPVGVEEIAPGRHEEMLQAVGDVEDERAEDVGPLEKQEDERDEPVAAFDRLGNLAQNHEGDKAKADPGAHGGVPAKEVEDEGAHARHDGGIDDEAEDEFDGLLIHEDKPDDGDPEEPLEEGPHPSEKRLPVLVNPVPEGRTPSGGSVVIADIGGVGLRLDGGDVFQIVDGDEAVLIAVADPAPFTVVVRIQNLQHHDAVAAVQRADLRRIGIREAAHVEIRRDPVLRGEFDAFGAERQRQRQGEQQEERSEGVAEVSHGAVFKALSGKDNKKRLTVEG